MTARGQLRVYLGAAPGVGKTYAMLDEGHRRTERGTDVVVAYAETHRRPQTAGKLEGLELIPRRTSEHRGVVLEEMDLDAVLARAPQVALVDELAHTNAPGSAHEKRWQDVEALLEAGIDVISTVNVQHLESLNDVVAGITGVPQRETVPDAVVRAAEQVELVDMSPEALRRRMAHGNIYAADKVDAALGNWFRVGNLAALRELALVWLADSVEDHVQRYREQHGIDTSWETRERVVVALTGGPEGETLLRRASRIASRSGSGELLAVHVARSDGLTGASAANLIEQRRLVESLGGSYHSVVGEDVPRALLDFARASNATQIVLGASRRSALSAALTGPGTGATTTRLAGSIDVHMVGHDYVGRGRVLPDLRAGLSRRRRLLGLALTVLLLGALTPLSVSLRSHLSLGSELPLFLLAVVLVSLVGGFYPAMLAAVAAALLVNFYLIPPLHTLQIAHADNVVAIIAFLLIAALVSRVVEVAARRTGQAARAGAEAEALSALARSVLRGEDALPALLDRIAETFGVSEVTLLRRSSSAPNSAGARAGWELVASTAQHPPASPEDSDTEVAVDDALTLALRGRVLPASDQRVLAAFAAQVGAAYRERQLAAAARDAGVIADADRMRTALLNAVSHDLRTPLAAAKASVSSLRDTEVRWSPEVRTELLASADNAIDRLTDLVTNLLDLSRLQAGAMPVSNSPVALDEVVSRALDHAAQGRVLDLDVSDALPEVLADPGLLERVIANLVQNALRFAPEGSPVRLAASSHAGRVELRVIDRGPGIPQADRDGVFAPFQRRDDRSAAPEGVGLGLAIARGFTEAMGGTLTMEDTPGGGLTMVIGVPERVACEPAAVPVPT